MVSGGFFWFYDIEILKTVEIPYGKSICKHSGHEILRYYILRKNFLWPFEGEEGVRRKHQIKLLCDKFDLWVGLKSSLSYSNKLSVVFE